MEAHGLDQANSQTNAVHAKEISASSRLQRAPSGKPPLAAEPHAKRRKQPDAESSGPGPFASFDSFTSNTCSPRIGASQQADEVPSGSITSEEAAAAAVVSAVHAAKACSDDPDCVNSSKAAANIEHLTQLLQDEQLMEEQFKDYRVQQQSQRPAQRQSEDVHMAPAEPLDQKENRGGQPCDPSQAGGCAPSPFARVMAAFDDAAELDTILSGIEGFQPAPVHRPHGPSPHRPHGPHAEGPLSRAASASRQGSAYPGMERTEVSPDLIPGSQPSPRLTAALLKALSTPKALSAVRALSALYPGLERPDVIQQLQKQHTQHTAAAVPISRGHSQWLSYPGMERGLSVHTQQGRAQSPEKQAMAAQRLGSSGRTGSDWLSYPGLERGFSGQAKPQQQPPKRILSGAESIKSRTEEPRHCPPGQCPPSAFACMAAEPLTRNPSGQSSYPGMERGFSSQQQHQAPVPKSSVLHSHQQRVASMQQVPSDWLSHPGMERGLSMRAQSKPAPQLRSDPPLSRKASQRLAQFRPALCLDTAYSVRSNLSDCDWPGMEQCFGCEGPSSGPKQAPQPKSSNPLSRKASQRLAAQAQFRPALCLDTAYSVRSNLSDCDWPGMEQCFGCERPSSGPKSAIQRKASIPLSRRSSPRLSSRAPALHTQLHHALCLETSYSVRSNLSDCEWPGMEQGFDCASSASPPSRLHQALCLECAPSLGSLSGSSDCDWPGLEAEFDCSSSASPSSRLRQALCLESAASVRSNISDCYHPGLERLLSLRAAAPALQRLVSIANQSQLQHALCLETAASVRSNISDAMWPGLEQCFAISSPPSKLQQALCLETAASVVSNLSDMMLSYPGMECEALYPLSRAGSMRPAPAEAPAARAAGQGRTEQAPAPGANTNTTGGVAVQPVQPGQASSKAGSPTSGGSPTAGSPRRAWSPMSRQGSAAKALPVTASPLGRLNKAAVSRLVDFPSSELPAQVHAAKLHPHAQDSTVREAAI